MGQHSLEGFGTYTVDGQTYQIALDTTIYNVVGERKGKKGAIGFEYTELASVSDVTITMTIGQ